MSKRKESFEPLEEGKVKLYVCGVTVYDYSHIGHARAYVAFDVLYRLLKHLDYDVNYVRNFTDVDDKIIKRASELKISVKELSQRFIAEFHKDMDTLYCQRPNFEPRATDNIEAMLEMIDNLITNNHAYDVNGDVFFDVKSLPNYGRLSGRSQEDNRAGERVAVDTRKRHPADFALWKSINVPCNNGNEKIWRVVSPWGCGRPGWHLECSAMVKKYMGPSIDIHGGGSDLIFPHHENEIAQCQGASSQEEKKAMINQQDFVKYWVHNGFVNINDEKMSKSLGNFFTVREVLKAYHPIVLRWFLQSVQYRSNLNYNIANLESANEIIYYIASTLEQAQQIIKNNELSNNIKPDKQVKEAQSLLQNILHGILDDLNTKVAQDNIIQGVTAINNLANTKQGRKNPKQIPLIKIYLDQLEQAFRILGLESLMQGWILIQELKDMKLQNEQIKEDYIQEQILKRQQLRNEKQFEEADKIRQDLALKKIAILDSSVGQSQWRPIYDIPK